MRVITGFAKGKPLKTLDGIDVRPTTDMIKEAMFSAIQFEIEGRRVLDLFSGSGALGIEALSRGAEYAVFADSSSASLAVTRENLEYTKLIDKAKIVNMPNSAYLRTCRESFGIALLDPPYGKGLIQKSLPALEEKMEPDGIIVCEHEKEARLPEEVGRFAISSVLKRGKTAVTIYRAKEVGEE